MLLYERTRNGFCLTFLRDPTKEIDCDIHRQRDFLVSRLWFRLASLGRAARLDRLRVAILSIALDIRVDLSALQHRTTSTLNFPFGAVLDRRRRQFLRSEEHTSELQSLMRISYAVYCLKKKKKYRTHT